MRKEIYRYRLQSRMPLFVACSLLVLFFVAACGGPSQQASTPARSSPPPTPTPGQGQRLLAEVAHTLNSARTIHSTLTFNISGQAANGIVRTEVWNEPPAKSRSVVLTSSLNQIENGSITVSDGKQVWQYDPQKKIVYRGPQTPDTTSTTGAAGRNGSAFGLAQSVFTGSEATFVSSSRAINGHKVYDLHVVPQDQESSVGSGLLNYAGEVYVDQASMLPVRIDLVTQGNNHIVIDFSTLELNAIPPNGTFSFSLPAGTKVLPLQQQNASASTGTISLAQAQAQAGYHLLSIPAQQQQYHLQGVNALGAPGNQIYTLNYRAGSTNFTITEGKALAGLSGTGGQQVQIRGTSGTLSSANGIPTLAWTEQGIGIHITGNLSANQLETIARALS